MREVASVGEVVTHYDIAQLAHSAVDREVGWGPGIRLYVGMDYVVCLLCPVYGYLLDNINVLVSPVIPLSRISFRILVRQDRAHRLQDGN